MANFIHPDYRVFEIIDRQGDPYFPIKSFWSEQKAINYCNDLNYDYGVQDRFYVNVAYDPSAKDEW